MRILMLAIICFICLELSALTVFEAVHTRDANAFNQLLKETPSLLDSQNTDGDTPLHLALADSIPDMITAILSHKPRLDIRNKGGFLPIHMAVQRQSVDVVKQLVAAGADITSKDSRMGGNALLWAADGGDLEVIRYLIDQGMNPNEASVSTWKPVDMAGSRGHLDALKLLLAKGTALPIPNDPNDYFFLFSINSGSLDLVEFLISQGFDPNYRTTAGDLAINQPIWYNNPAMLSCLISAGARINGVFDRYSFAPMHVAAFNGSLEMIKILLDNEAEIDLPKPNDGTTPLQIAIEFKKNDVAKFLITKGAELEHTDLSGNTPFNSAVSWENNEMARFLLDLGVDYVGTKCTIAQTCSNPPNPPLINAAVRNAEILQVLLDKGVDINTVNNDGDTALLSSVWSDSLASIQLLISRKADLNKQNKRGVNALILASQYQNTTKAELLIKAGCDISQKDNSGKNALHFAAIKGDVAMVNLLLSNGINKNLKDKDKLTPLDYAMRYARTDVVQLLQTSRAKGRFKQTAQAQNRIDFTEGTTGVWYLEHSGMAVRNGNNLLIFDYWKQQPATTNPSLYNGWINPEEIKDLNVYVFVSHSDMDHYDKRTFDWQTSIPNLKYVFGFRPQATAEYRQNRYPLPQYVYVPKDSSLILDGMYVKTLSSPIDDGSGFYVEINGVKFLHCGDAVNQSKPLPGDYSRSVDHLAAQISGLDFAFVPMLGCGMNDVEALNLGNDYLINKLKPEVVIPMHSGGSEYKYDDWCKTLKTRGINHKTLTFHNPGDHFTIIRK